MLLRLINRFIGGGIIAKNVIVIYCAGEGMAVIDAPSLDRCGGRGEDAARRGVSR